MSDPMVWVGLAVSTVLGGSFLTAVYAYLRNKKKIDETFDAASTVVKNWEGIQKFNSDRTAALTTAHGDTLLQELIAAEGAVSTKKFYPNIFKDSTKVVSTDYLLSNVKDVFDEVIPVRITEEENGESNYTYKCMRGTEYCFLEIASTQRRYYHKGDKTKPRVKANNFVVEHYLNEDETYNLLSYGRNNRPISILVPVTQTNMKIDLIGQAIGLSMMEQIEYKEEKNENIAYFRKMVLNPVNGQFSFEESRMNAAIIKEAGKFYAPVTFDHEGSLITLPAEAMIAVSAQALLSQRSVALFGGAGFGKTRAAAEIARIVAQQNDTAVIHIDAGIVHSLANAQMRGMFEYALQNVPEPNRVFFIDEAETALRKTGDSVHSNDNTFALSFLDGLNSDYYRASALLTFNADPSELNEKIFRSGRIAYTFQFNPLNEEQADDLVEYAKTLPEYASHVFSTKKFRSFLDTPSSLPGAKPYAPIGFTTVADVMSCFVPPVEEDLLNNKLKEIIADPSKASVFLETVMKEIRAKNKANSRSKGVELVNIRSAGNLGIGAQSVEVEREF